MSEFSPATEHDTEVASPGLPSSCFIEVRDATLHYRHHRSPKPSPLTLLLLHGFGASAETWHDVVPSLALQYNLIRVDLKGFGLSSKPRRSPYTLHEQAELIADFVSCFSTKDFVLLGHSYGGAVAFLTYLKLRDRNLVSRLKGLILIDSASYPQRLPFFIARLRNPVIRCLMRTFTTPEWRMRYVLTRIFANKRQVDENRVQRYARFLRLPGAEHAIARTAIELPPRDAEELSLLLKTIDLPTQILWGSLDPVIPVAKAHQLHRDIPASLLDVIPGSGHVPHEEHPDATAAVILKFMRRLQPCP